MRTSTSPGRTAAPNADVLLVGVAIRPCAQSARRAGYRVISVDPFGDRDHRRAVRNRSLKRDGRTGIGEPDRSAEPGPPADAGEPDRERGGDLAPALVELSERVRERCPEVAYGSSFENHPGLVRRLAGCGRLLGNAPDVLGAVRDPDRLFGALRESGFDVPRYSVSAETPPTSVTRWLRKPRRGGGGRGVRPWRGGDLAPSEYLQEEIHGRPGSILFVAGHGRVRLLGLTEMLVGWPDFGAPPFAYCGSVLTRDARLPPLRVPVSRGDFAGDDGGSRDDRRLLGLARRMAACVAGTFGLRGVCGIDVIRDRGTLWPLEVNPRYTAAMELLEGRLSRPVFELHRRACTEAPGAAVPGDLEPRASGEDDAVRGKAVLRARRECRAPDVARAVADVTGVQAADLPDRGERIRAGAPLCTLLASGDSRSACLHALRRAADRVYAATGVPGYSRTAPPPRSRPA